MQHGFTSQVAVGFVGQKNQAGGATVPLDRLVARVSFGDYFLSCSTEKPVLS